jgi:hypothetical protein
VIETVTRIRLDAPVERLVPHPRLPLIAGVDVTRPAVHVWDLELRPVGSVGADAPVYGGIPVWERYRLVPELAWHPHEPILLVSAGGTLTRWSPAGVSPSPGRYSNLAFSPDGGTVWASPASSGDGSWRTSDVVDLTAGVIGTGPSWDTGVAEHPAGGLIVTLSSDQGATFGLFADVADRSMQVRGRALMLDVDGYETPVWSPDGRRFAVRGNAYVQSLAVYAFPSLKRVLATELTDPYPGHPTPPEWLERLNAWSRHNIAFANDPDVLWIGTLIAFDLAAMSATEHPVSGAGVTALASVTTGRLALADDAGDLVLLSVPGEPVTADADTVAAFIGATEPVVPGGDLWEQLELTDGVRTWRDDLDTVSEADDSDPTWLRLQAAINRVRDATGD